VPPELDGALFRDLRDFHMRRGREEERT